MPFCLKVLRLSTSKDNSVRRMFVSGNGMGRPINYAVTEGSRWFEPPARHIRQWEVSISEWQNRRLTGQLGILGDRTYKPETHPRRVQQTTQILRPDQLAFFQLALH